MSNQTIIFGKLSAAAGNALPLAVCHSRTGYYLGTHDEHGPYTRESAEYWPSSKEAEKAMVAGAWTQRLTV